MQENPNIETITFKVVQMKSLAVHITNQKLCFDMFMVINLQNIFMEHDLYVTRTGIKEKIIFGYCYKYTPATAFVLQSHTHIYTYYFSFISLSIWSNKPFH